MHFPVVNRIERVSQASDMDILDRIVALMQGISASSMSTPSSPWMIEGLDYIPNIFQGFLAHTRESTHQWPSTIHHRCRDMDMHLWPTEI